VLCKEWGSICPFWPEAVSFVMALKQRGLRLNMKIKQFLTLQSDLNLKQVGGRTTYSDLVNPSIFNEFEAAALRFGHSLIPGDFPEIE
jgi:hypothetical protein